MGKIRIWSELTDDSQGFLLIFLGVLIILYLYIECPHFEEFKGGSTMLSEVLLFKHFRKMCVYSYRERYKLIQQKCYLLNLGGMNTVFSVFMFQLSYLKKILKKLRI